MTELTAPEDPDDIKIIALARASRTRTNAAQGACVRDTDGRTYSATSVTLEHLALSAIQVAVAMAVSSGAAGLESVALVARVGPTEADLAVLAELPGVGVKVWVCDWAGTVSSIIDLTSPARR